MDRTRLARAPPRSQVEMGIRRTIYVAMPEQFAHHFRATPAWAGRCEMMAMPSGRRTVTAGRLSRLPAPTRSTRPRTSGERTPRRTIRFVSHTAIATANVAPSRTAGPCCADADAKRVAVSFARTSAINSFRQRVRVRDLAGVAAFAPGRRASYVRCSLERGAGLGMSTAGLVSRPRADVFFHVHDFLPRFSGSKRRRGGGGGRPPGQLVLAPRLVTARVPFVPIVRSGGAASTASHCRPNFRRR